VVQYFELQYAESNVAANTIDAFLDELLPQERIVENVLRRPLVEELVRLYGALHYLECFILEPWQFLGGEEDPKNFKKGDVCVNADLVAQTMVQMS
jgi:hypothetical protein